MSQQDLGTKFLKKTFKSFLPNYKTWISIVEEISKISNSEKEIKKISDENEVIEEKIRILRKKINRENSKIEKLKKDLMQVEKKIRQILIPKAKGKKKDAIRTLIISLKQKDPEYKTLDSKRVGLKTEIKNLEEKNKLSKKIVTKVKPKPLPKRGSIEKKLFGLLQTKQRIFETTIKEVKKEISRKRRVLNESTERLKPHKEFFENYYSFKKFFDELFDYPLTESQRHAILTDQDRTLAVASAGSGKTSTLLGKYSYLVESKKAKEDEILILAFNKAVRTEIEDKLVNLGYQDNITRTFHALGKEVLDVAEIPNSIDSICSNGDDPFLTTKNLEFLISRAAASDPDYMLKFLEFSATCPNDLKATFAENEKEYYEKIAKYPYRRSAFKINEEYRALRIPCLDGVSWVRSQQELFIANTLYINGIDFVYEEPLKTDEKNNISPDFYFPQINCWYEHYAVDEKGKSPFGKKYEISHKLKEEFYKANKIDYFSTNLSDYMKGEIENKIFKELLKRGLKRNVRSKDEIDQNIQKIYRDNVRKLLSEMITLYKEKDISLDEFKIEIEHLEDQTRAQKFYKIFIPLLKEYQDLLESNQTIDFSDQILKATKILKSKQNSKVNSVFNFKYILVDEFQDISSNRGKLINALLDQNKDCKLFAVGDDWQSIYRFSGSDISFITDFKTKYLPKKSQVKIINETHRFPIEICDLASTFIQKNENQAKKEVITKSIGGKITLCEVEKYSTEYIKKILNQIERSQIRKANSVFVLSRINHDLEDINFSELEKYRPDLDFKTGSIHKAKGLERDFVILLGMDGGMFGFPRLTSEDSLKTMLLPKEDPYPNAEERRVMYVALTRAKKHVFVVSAPGKDAVFYEEPSEFFFEVENICKKLFPKEKNIFRKLNFVSSIPCPKCKEKSIDQKMRIKTVRRTTRNFPNVFMGCNGFTANKERHTFCDYTFDTVPCPNCLSLGKKGLLSCIKETNSGREKYFVSCNACEYKEDYFSNAFQKRSNE